MRLYTPKPDKIIRQHILSCGKIGDSYYKVFEFSRIHPLILCVDDSVAEIIDKCNSEFITTYNSIKGINKRELQYRLCRGEVIDELNIYQNLTENQIESVKYLSKLLKETKNILYEFSDSFAERWVTPILDCEFKPFEGQIDSDIWLAKKKESDEINLTEERNRINHLIEFGAFKENYQSLIKQQESFINLRKKKYKN